MIEVRPGEWIESPIKKVFIIGSTHSSEKEILTAEAYFNAMGWSILRPLFEKLAECEKNKNGVSIDSIMRAFHNIYQADLIIVVPKENGELGDGSTYEMAYAATQNKTIKRFDVSINDSVFRSNKEKTNDEKI